MGEQDIFLAWNTRIGYNSISNTLSEAFATNHSLKARREGIYVARLHDDAVPFVVDPLQGSAFSRYHRYFSASKVLKHVLAKRLWSYRILYADVE
ncbi:hypothetical protein GCM10010910_27580 [Microbacterium nanhaiense]|uniref:Uncharacterized protein n=1 Tax=Microbacterium nanhaiense TaxID=1301026 RepID=A0ABQ2N4P4_9MICO|nr:hypothetical protein GCM10010910_27580 [Microbacterium nanhaiense]